jgi:hypothetical protein
MRCALQRALIHFNADIVAVEVVAEKLAELHRVIEPGRVSCRRDAVFRSGGGR